MLTSLRTWLALLRLLLLYALFCAVVFAAALMLRDRRDQGLGLATPLPPPSAVPYFGITAELDGLDAGAQAGALKRLAQMEVGWVRVRLSWDALEPAPGQFEWDAADQLIAAVTGAELLPVVVLDNCPAWARDPRDRETPDGLHAPPADVTDYARVAAAVAARYGAWVDHYQLWDEPNIAPNWGERHIEAAEYARLLKAGASAIRAADPSAVILLAALAPTADRGHTAQDEVYYLQRLYAAGAAPYFDAVAAQPFGFGRVPKDPRVDRAVLNFRRTLLVRRTMLAAGDGATPIWIVRFGWNRHAPSPWATVSPARQTAYALAALELAYHRWPWVAAQGWVIDQPQAPADSPEWGFALTPSLEGAFRAWSWHAEWTPRTITVATPAPLWPPVGVILLVAIALAWRTWAVWQVLPWRAWRTWLRRRTAGQFAAIWLGLLVAYYFATWPPLVLACWLVAALLLLDRPLHGLVAALVLLPLHAYHKEINLVVTQFAVPPAHAALLCLLPAAFRHLPCRHSFCLAPSSRKHNRDLWHGLALGWLLVALPGMLTVWHWPAYLQGLADLVIVPLLLYLLVRVHAHSSAEGWQTLATALWLGGALVALWGLTGWFLGDGTLADGMRRLTGPTSSPNHLALYLERTLLLGLGLQWQAQGRTRLRLALGNILVAAALVLTGSRGALLLALPAGALLVAWVRWRRRAWLGGAMVVAGALTVALLGDRLQNSATLNARFETWSATLPLVRDTLLTGLGPGGYFWRFPAYLPLNTTLDPNLRHPHTLLLELLVLGGVWAPIWFVAACFVVARRLGQISRLTWPFLGIVAALAAAVAHAQVDAFFSLPDLAAWNWAALALIATVKPTIQKSPPSGTEDGDPNRPATAS